MNRDLDSNAQLQVWASQIGLLEAAWGLIANAGWDGLGKTEGWREAAEAWRTRYFEYLDEG
jgi:hypothetical protein